MQAAIESGLDECSETSAHSSLFEIDFLPSSYYSRPSSLGNDTEDFNMGDRSNRSANFPSMDANPSSPPQLNPIGESPEGSDVLERPDLGQVLYTTGTIDSSLLGVGMDMPQGYPNGYGWHPSLPQSLSAFDGQDWNSAVINSRFNESGFREDFVSEPESYETLTDIPDQKYLKKQTRKFPNKVSCKHPGCESYFSKKADMDRHFGSMHEEAGFICGDCENEGAQPSPKRKDHFAPHLRNHLKEHRGYGKSTWEDFKKCPWPICQPANQKQTRLFSDQRSLEQHLILKHAGKMPELYRKSEAVSPFLPITQCLLDWENPTAGTKHTCDHEYRGAKRPRQEDFAIAAQATPDPRWKGKELSIMSSDSDNNGKSGDDFESKYLPQSPSRHVVDIERIGNYESFVPNVSIVDFLTFLRLSGNKSKAFEWLFSVNLANSKKHEIPDISFNTTQKSITLRGDPDLIGLCKAYLKAKLRAIRSSKPLVFLDSASTNKRLGAKDRLRTDFRSPLALRKSSSNPNKIFAVRKGRDASLIRQWTKKILPSLLKILDDSIGREYSASLIREGTSEESALAVVRIESPQIPAKTTKDYILQQLDESCGFILADNGIAVDFSAGSLELLAGYRMAQVREAVVDDKRELPFHTRYWKYPGMGASIGLLCTEEEFATLGCYIEVDKQKFILTVDHFIEKSYRKLRSGIEERRTITSPALAKVKKMKKELGHLLSSIEGEMQAEVLQQFGERSVSWEDLDPPPRDLFEVYRKHNFISEFIEELKKDEKDFRIGSLAHQCESNSTAPLCSEHSDLAADLDAFSEIDKENCHRMDWALFTVDERVGANRHRYRYDKDNGTTDYFTQDKDHGEGDICQDTCITEPNEKVYFVGQTNGRLNGEINGTLRAVVYEGRKTLEHHIIISPEQKKKGKEYGGDSGAAVLRASDDKLIGIVWGSFNDDPIFTPIGATFANIKKTLEANDVHLPRVPEDPTPPVLLNPSTANQVLLISGSESEVEPQRPFKSSDIILPKLSKKMTERHSRHTAAKILEMVKRGPIFAPNIRTTLPTTPNEESSSPTPSLSFSCSPSPKPIQVSPSSSETDLTVMIGTVVEPVVTNQEDIDASFPTRDNRHDCTLGYNCSDCFKEKLDLHRKLSTPYLPTIGNRNHRKRRSYPQLLRTRLPQHSITWPFKAFDPWDNLVEGSA